MLLTRLPLGIATSFDLHVLGTPPALILSQDQTLHKILARMLFRKAYRSRLGSFDLLTRLPSFEIALEVRISRP